MSTIKSSDEHLTLNADGSSKDIKFQANGVEKASISSSGAFTSTTIDATKLTGDLPAISGANLTGVGVSGITSAADATAIKIDSSERVAIGNTDAGNYNGTADNLVVYDASNHAGITIANGGANKVGAIYFADGTSGTSEYEGYIEYNHNNDNLNFGTNHASRMLISSNGHVTKPSQPSAFVNGGGNNYIQVNANSPAPFSNIEHQTGGSNYNTSNYRYTAPVAGWYQVSFGILANDDMSQEWMVNKNGTHIFRCYGKDRSWYCSGVYYCSASDYLEVVSGASNSGNLYANTGASTYSWASYRLLG